ncbi:MAG: 30S ribosomal protein S20 [Deltaproteobacteria bacterium]|nr:30S ribosomal protein S20 [Deltaproteobacteria bacterium]
MANHKSALKRARQSENRRLRNRGYKTRVKKAVKDVRSAIAENAPEQAQANLKTAVSLLQKTATKGVIKHRTASRKISRLSRQVHRLSS